jgi:hypothetical protein
MNAKRDLEPTTHTETVQNDGELSDAQLDHVAGGLLIGGGAKQEKKTLEDYWYAIFYA